MGLRAEVASLFGVRSGLAQVRLDGVLKLVLDEALQKG